MEEILLRSPKNLLLLVLTTDINAKSQAQTQICRAIINIPCSRVPLLPLPSFNRITHKQDSITPALATLEEHMIRNTIKGINQITKL
jgi:hypothetical protein